MALPTTNLKVTATDNELYIVAIPSAGNGSFEICHFKSGYNAAVNYNVNPAHILPKGDYTLTMIGINWGGSQAFSVTLTGPNPGPFVAPAGTTVGCVWCKNVAITV